MNIAMITGASSGIGEEYLRQIILGQKTIGAAPFDEIWAIARRVDRLTVLKNDLDPVRIRVFQKDLTSKEALDSLRDTLAEEQPTLRLLINCAGVGRTGRFEKNTQDEVHAMIALNCSALAELTWICLPYMIPAGDLCSFRSGPRIMNIASSAGFLPQPGFAVYAATKSFVIHFSRAIQTELRMHRIAVTTVCPGPVETDFVSVASGTAGAKPKGFKALFVVQPGRLVRKSLLASQRGRGLYVFGFSQKILHVISKTLPSRFFAFIISKNMSDE